MVLRAERDEIVPREVGERFEEAVERLVEDKRVVVVRAALHCMVLEKQQGRDEVKEFLEGE